MSELKVIKAYFPTFDADNNEMLLVSHTKENYMPAKQIECYLKSEADKVIAHQKYKRCLAMARWCGSRACFYDTMRENGLYWVWKSDRAYKLHKRWLELAEKFREASK